MILFQLKGGLTMKRRNGRVKNASKRNVKVNEMVKKTAVAAGAVFGAVGLVNNEVYAESQKEVTDETLATHNQIDSYTYTLI